LCVEAKRREEKRREEKRREEKQLGALVDDIPSWTWGWKQELGERLRWFV
jgi:hypothetical protein